MPDTMLSLVGFFSEPMAHAYLLKACKLEPHQRTAEQLSKVWQEARRRLGNPIARAGQPQIRPIPTDYYPYLQEVMAHPRFVNPLDGMEVDFAIVEIEPLLAYQAHIWREHAATFTERLRQNPGFDQILEMCLPTQVEAIGAEIDISRHSDGDGTIFTTIVVKDLDVETQELRIHPTNHPSAPILGWQQRRKLPYVQVVEHGGRYYLRNGYHRVIALYTRGVREVPCILLHATRHDQIGMRRETSFDPIVFESDNPPAIAHFTQGRAVRLPLQKYEYVIGVQERLSGIP